jgi:Ca2+/Na+ antiporter
MFMQKTPNADSSILGAVLYLSIMIFFYLLAINVFFELYLKVYKIPDGLFELIFLFIGYILYFFNKKYFNKNEIITEIITEILEKFKNENSKTKIIGAIFVYSNVIFSIVFFMLITYFSQKQK